MKRLASGAAALGLPLGLLAAWQIACLAFQPSPVVLPSPFEVARALFSDAPALLASAWTTFAMALAALALAILLATPMALLTAVSRTAEAAVRPLAVTLQVTPVVAIAPLVVIWAGLDHAGRAIVALAAVVAFFPIYSGLATGLRSADPDLARLFDLYGATRGQRLLRLQLPASLPFALEGLKVAIGLAVIGAVVAEFVAGSGQAQGLAWRILEAEHQLQTDRMFAALAVLAALGAGLHAAASAVERLGLRHWRGRD